MATATGLRRQALTLAQQYKNVTREFRRASMDEDIGDRTPERTSYSLGVEMDELERRLFDVLDALAPPQEADR